MEHDALRILSRTGDADAVAARIAVTNAGEGIPPGRATTNSPELLMRMALNGAGITVINDHFRVAVSATRRACPGIARLAFAAGRGMGSVPGRRLMPARTRVFLDALAEKFAPGVSGDRGRRQKTKAELRKRPVRRPRSI